MDVDALVKATVSVGTPLLALIGYGSRRHRLRKEIRDNLALVDELEKHKIIRDHTLAAGWLQGRIVVDVARLSGQQLGIPKAAIPKGDVAFALVLALLFGFWTYWIVRDGFVWYSVFPGIVAGLLLISVFGMVTDRELPPEETGNLPPGAVLARTDTASEQVATSVAFAASGGVDDRLAPGGQADVVLRFVHLMQRGDYESGIALADDNWIRCRVHAWLWNNRDSFGDDTRELERIAEGMLDQRSENDNWRDFVAAESGQFTEVWGPINLDQFGVASRRRRVARDIDLVILAPVGSAGGYFVMTATAIPDALSFAVARHPNGWFIANHVGFAPPQPRWPPAWWYAGDPAIDALPEPGLCGARLDVNAEW